MGLTITCYQRKGFASVLGCNTMPYFTKLHKQTILQLSLEDLNMKKIYPNELETTFNFKFSRKGHKLIYLKKMKGNGVYDLICPMQQMIAVLLHPNTPGSGCPLVACFRSCQNNNEV